MKKVWIGSLVLIILIIFSFLVYWHYSTQNIRKSVLSQLEKNFKFCSIVKDNINVFSGSGNFWMICNGRPFYTEYRGELLYRLNGWDFLITQVEFEEVANCDVYEANLRKISFVCPGKRLLQYDFNIDNFQINKVGEENFEEIFSSKLKEKFDFLSDCEVKNFTEFVDFFPAYQIEFSCKDIEYLVKTNLQSVLILPANEKDIKEAFKNLFGIEPRINGSMAFATFDFGNLTIDYASESIYINPMLSVEDVLKRIGNKFLLIKEVDAKFVKEVEERGLLEKVTTRYYLSDNNIISVRIKDGIILGIWVIGEGFYE